MAGLNTIGVLRRVFFLKDACRYGTLSSMVLLVYDYVITFPDEVNLVWRSPRSSAKIIFFLNRYFVLLFCGTYTFLMLDSAPTEATCKAAFDLQVWSNWVGCLLVELLLQFWVNAVYKPTRRWLGVMISLYIILTASSAAALSVVLRKVSVEIEMPGCELTAAHDESAIMKTLLGASQPRVPPLMLICLLPSVIYELFLLALLVRKAIQFNRAGGPFSCSKNPVAGVLIRDSVTYFVIILIAFLGNSLIWTFAPSQLFQIGVGFGITLPSLLGSRLLLNLRGAYQRTHHFTPTVSLEHTTRWDHLCLDPAAGQPPLRAPS